MSKLTKKHLLEKICYDQIRPQISADYLDFKDNKVKVKWIPIQDVDFITSLVIAQVRKIIRNAK